MTTDPTISEPREAWFDENRLVASVVAFVGAIGVTVGVLEDDVFGAQATLALIMLALGVAGLVWPRQRI